MGHRNSTSDAAFRLSNSITGAAWILLASLVCVLLQASLCSSASNNPIDNCWNNVYGRHDRKALADCGVGFGSGAIGGKTGPLYTVTTPVDNPTNPPYGSLRYGVTRKSPLWISFAQDMTIKLEMPLVLTSDKTIDARFKNIQIGNGPCLRVVNVNNVIIHGLRISNCVPNSPGNVLVSEGNVLTMEPQDGDGISVAGSTNIWLDHNTLSQCQDGLIDVTLASTAVTISNNRFSNHDKAMLLGHSDDYDGDSNMKVTVAYNHFGPALTQRMPRARFGYVHVVNNYYEPWGSYAIGGSMHPTIRSEGNQFVAPSSSFTKQVTKREHCELDSSCDAWLWVSVGDEFFNGAYFNESGRGTAAPPYLAGQKFRVGSGNAVPPMTQQAGAWS